MRGRVRLGLAAGLSLALVALVGCSTGEPTEETTPEATATTPSGPPAQPEGPDGFTWEIQNWDEWADDPAVLTWKRFNEAFAASVAQKELLPAVRETTSREGLDVYLAGFEYARDNDLRTPEVAKAKIIRVEREGQTASVVSCSWGESISLLRADGEMVGTNDGQYWIRQTATLSGTDDAGWVVDDASVNDGRCEGDPPA